MSISSLFFQSHFLFVFLLDTVIILRKYAILCFHAIFFSYALNLLKGENKIGIYRVNDCAALITC